MTIPALTRCRLEMSETDITELKADFKQRTIGVLMGGLSSEKKVSEKSGSAVLQALQERGYRAEAVATDRKVAQRIVQQGIETAFLALHGNYGEDGSIQGMLEILAVPYTGSSVLASAIVLNKTATKKILLYHGLATPAFQSLRIADADTAGEAISMQLPFVVKPCEEGSTIGLQVVTHEDDIVPAVRRANCFSRNLLVEDFVQGREVTVGVLYGKALTPVEIIPAGDLYDYRAKYLSGDTTYVVDPALPDVIRKRLASMAEQAYHALGCSGAIRVDFIIDAERGPYILELNTIPGMTERSLLPMAAEHDGIGFADLVENMLWGASLYKKEGNAVL